MARDWDDDEELDDEVDELEDIEDDCELPPLTEAAIQLHEVYLALVEAGFEAYDALRMITWLISEQGIGDVEKIAESDDE